MRHYRSSARYDDPQRTPALGFCGGQGAPQGDVSSPAAWVAVCDILLRASEVTLSTPSGVRGQDADDLNTFSATWLGLQAQADIVSAFSTLFGLRIAANKLSPGIIWGLAKLSARNHHYKPSRPDTT